MTRSRKPIVIASYQGRRGHPVLFDRALFSELMEAPEDQGARVVVNANPARVSYIDVEDAGTLLDLDTPADLAQGGFASAAAPVGGWNNGTESEALLCKLAETSDMSCNPALAALVIRYREIWVRLPHYATGVAPLILTRN